MTAKYRRGPDPLMSTDRTITQRNIMSAAGCAERLKHLDIGHENAHQNERAAPPDHKETASARGLLGLQVRKVGDHVARSYNTVQDDRPFLMPEKCVPVIEPWCIF